MDQRQPAIRIDDLGDKRLADISAADFLAALSTGAGIQVLRALPEKKKVELEIPDTINNIPVGDLILKLTEKKKFELEKPPGFEGIFDFGRNQVVLEDLMETMVTRVEERLRQRQG